MKHLPRLFLVALVAFVAALTLVRSLPANEKPRDIQQYCFFCRDGQCFSGAFYGWTTCSSPGNLCQGPPDCAIV